MKTLTSLTLTIFFVLAFAAVGSAQASGKIGVINTQAFSEPGTGITKYVNAVRSVEAELAPAIKEIDTLTARLQTLEKEIKQLQGSVSTADQQTGQRKVEEYEKLRRDYQFKQEDVKARYERRFNTVTTPLSQAIGAALTEFAKKNGYALILDISRDTAGVIIAVADEKADITSAFIAYYNARP
jgi:Skp family chaperone for outer membrane proteins